MQQGVDHSQLENASGTDLENRLRGLILSNGVPDALKTASAIDESNVDAITPESVPPHLRSALVTEQQEYLRRHRKQVNNTDPTSVSATRKPIQAQDQRGPTKRHDATSPSAASPPAPQNNLQQTVQTSQGRLSTTAPKNTQHARDTAVVPLDDPSNGTLEISTAPKSQVVLEPPQKSRAQTTHVSVAPKKGQHVPYEGHHSQFTKSPSSFNRLPDNQNQVIPHNPNPQGQQRFQARQNGNAPWMNGQKSFLASRNIHNAPDVSQNHPEQTANYMRPPKPSSKQLYDPNGQNLDAPSQLHIPVPGPMRTSYLESLAACEIPKAEITSRELREKETLRIILNELCRQTVSAYETAKDALFNPESVALKCFGSLSSGYATHGSDMDLVLVSPNSMPDAASPESEIPRLLEKMLLNRGYGARLLTRTRVPIIRFCEKPTPELFEALKDNRTKWEKERDLPPKPKRKQKDSNTRSKTQARKQSDLMAEKAETRSVPPADNLEGSIVVRLPFGINGGVYGKFCNQEFPKEMEVETRSVVSGENPSAAIVVRLPDADDNQGQHQLSLELSANEEEKAERPPHSEQQSNAGKEGVNQPVENTLQDPTFLVTGMQPPNPPIERTDDELVRLYTLAMNEGWFNDEERVVIYRFVNTVKHPKGKELGELEESRIALKDLPDVLSRYRERPQDLHLDFPKDGVGIQCDINFSNFLALHNTLLLRCYSHCDPRIRLMIIFVKAWAKKRKINSPYHGTLSSYGYVLMVLHYVVNVANPPLAPNLQIAWKATPNEKPEENECEGCNVRFWRSEKEIRTAANRGLLTTNRQSLGSLLRGFFQYFAHEGTDFLRDRQFLGHGFSWSYNVLSLRTYGGLLTKQEKGWTGARIETIEPTVMDQEAKEVKHRYLFAIEDPFEIDHNVARPVAHHGIVAIRDEFRRAHKLILNVGFSNGVAVDLFEEGKEHVQERLFFGPNPARFNRPRRPGPPKVDGDANGTTSDQQGTKSLKDVSPKARDTMKHGPVTRDPLVTPVKTREVDRIGEKSASDTRSPDGIASPDSPISLNEDMRG
ncbi:Zinc finger, CCHC domain-containing protein [Xylographa carneopallida]|nr:Zinc finger, CCHC domain-containing protein [Xylographa carneopallida]